VAVGCRSIEEHQQLPWSPRDGAAHLLSGPANRRTREKAVRASRTADLTRLRAVVS